MTVVGGLEFDRWRLNVGPGVQQVGEPLAGSGAEHASGQRLALLIGDLDRCARLLVRIDGKAVEVGGGLGWVGQGRPHRGGRRGREAGKGLGPMPVIG